jgi:indole-3-glycerol phosphate synthase
LDILERVAAAKRAEVAAEMRALPMRRAIELAVSSPPAHPFATALTGTAAPAIVAEIGGRSARGGADGIDGLARRLEAAGAVALSVLTDEQFQQGSTRDLVAARAAASIPILRKDFLIEEYQVYRSRAIGADALLLIARLVPPRTLTTLIGVARSLHMEALVEVRDAADLEHAVACGADLLLVNARGGTGGEPALETAIRLAGLVPAGTTRVAAGAVETSADLARLAAAGFRAALVGERLMREADPAETLRRLLRGELT